MALAPVGIQVVATNVNSFLAAVNSMNRRMQLFGSTARTASKNTGGLSTGISRLGGQITKLGNQATRAGLSLSFLATAPIALAFSAATQAAIDFERELVKINTLAGLPSEQIRTISNEILGMGSAIDTTGIAIETGIPPVELAAAAYNIMSKSSRDVSDASLLAAHTIEVLGVAARASAIGLGEVDIVAGALTSIMAAYGQENITAARAGDVLTAAVDRGAFEADELAGSVGKVLGILVNMGVSFEEAAAFAATFSLAGTTASESLTGLRRVMLAFLRPTGSTADALEAIGTNVDEIQASIRESGLLNTLLSLKDRLAEVGLGFDDVFTRETGLNAALLLTGELSQEYIDNLEAIEGANGKLDASFSAVAQTTGFQLDQLRASFHVLSITIGNAFLPVVNLAVQRLLPLIKVIADWAAQNPKILLIATALALVTAVIGPLLIGIGFLIGAIGSIVGAFGTLLSIIGALISPIGLLVVAIVGLGVAIVTGLAAGIQHLRRTGDDAAAFFDNIGQRALGWGRNIVLQLAKGIIQGIVYVVNALAQLGRIIAGFLAPGSPPALLPDLPEWGESAMQEWINGFAAADFSLFNTIANTISQFLRSTAEENDDTLIPTILGIRNAIGEVIAQVREMGDVSAEAIAQMVADLNLGNAQLESYVTALLNVAEASERVAEIQQEISDINSQFDSIVGPLNDELDALRDREREIERNAQLAAIGEALQDPDLTPQERELLLIRQRQLELEAQIETQEELRDEALSAAEEALAAAEEELASLQEEAERQQELINLQIDHNNLLREQMSLLAGLTESLKDVAGAIGDASDELAGIGEGFSAGDFWDPEEIDLPEFNLSDLIGEETLAAAENLTETLSGIFDPLKEDIDALKAAWEGLGLAWGPVVSSIIEGTAFDSVRDKLQPTIDYINGLPATIFVADWSQRFADNFGQKLIAARFIVESLVEGDFFAAGLAFARFILSGLEEAFLIGELVATALAGLLVSMYNWFVAQDWVALWANFTTKTSEFLSGMWTLFKIEFDTLLRELTVWFETQDWQTIGENAMTALLEGLKFIFTFVTDTLPSWLGDLIVWIEETFTAEAGAAALQAGKDFVQDLIDGIGDSEILSALWQAILNLATGALNAWREFWSANPLSLPSIGGGADTAPSPPPAAGGGPNAGAQGGAGGRGGMAGTRTAASGFSSPIIVVPRPTVPMAPAMGPINMNFNTQIMSGDPKDEAWFRNLVRQEVAAVIGRGK